MITPKQADQLDADATALILNIMQQNAKDASYISESLMHAYKADVDRLRAELNAVRARVYALFDEGCQPTESRILAALWPDSSTIEEFIEKEN